ncbi:MAG: ribulokinase [Spirochaetota bacterium]
MPRYIIGVDFGTDSVRSVIMDAATGREEASRVEQFPRWSRGEFCDPAANRFRQHPLDHMESLVESIRGALEAAPHAREQVTAIGVDTTGSTPAPVDREGTVLALNEEFAGNPNAMFILWKDHTAVEEAEEINRTARTWGGTDFTRYEGGVYSSEWFWSKILHVYREDPAVREAAFSWVEHADWVTALLTGTLDPLSMKRSRCAAGHKAMWHEEWEGLPSEEFLRAVDPLLGGLRERLYRHTHTADQKAGELTGEWARRLGLPPGITVGVGAFDAHAGAVGAQIRPGSFVMILGTSACDMAVAPPELLGDTLVEGICGQVDGSIVPGMVGLEAGQSAFGDVYAWFRDLLMWPVRRYLEGRGEREEIERSVIDRLSEEAAGLPPEDPVPVALDWLNGRRTPYADQKLKGALVGLRLGTDAPRVFRSLVESTAFGTMAIIERFRDEGVKIEEVVAAGGIPRKAPYVMQVLADVLNLPVKVCATELSGALGAAMLAAVAAGVYPDVLQAQEHMGSGFLTTYRPRKGSAAHYRGLYRAYREIGGLLEEQLRNL